MNKVEMARQLAKQASEQEQSMTVTNQEWQMPKEDWEVMLETLSFMAQNSSNQLGLLVQMDKRQRKQAEQLTAIEQELLSQHKSLQQMQWWVRALTALVIGGMLVSGIYLALK